MSPATGNGIQFERFQGDLQDSDRATAETVACMCKYIADAQSDPGVWQAALESRNWGNPVAGAFWWPKHHIKFVQDDVLVSQLLNERDQLELLVTPPVMVRSSKPRGDCDDFTMMVCALLKCLGVGFEIVTVAADGHDPSRFSHVFCRAVLSDGSRIPLDASHGKYPGWCVPASRTYRMQVWDEQGNPIKDVASRKWQGLHGYVAGLGACGDCIETDEQGACMSFDENCDDGGSTTFTPTGPVAPPLNGTYTPPTNTACPSGLVMLGGNCVIAGSTVTSSTAGGVNTTPGISSLIASIFGSGSQIATTFSQPTVPVGSVAIPTNSLLLYGGLAFVGLIALVLVSKK